jgi:tRNA wybutosine-synthesizing protein 3
MNSERNFLENKKNALKKLKKAKNENKVDKGIIPILNIINNYEDFYTSSSCFGRIVILEIPDIGNKKEAEFLGKWHRKIRVDELISSFKYANIGQLWILTQSPIIHVGAKTNTAAENLLKTALSCGFKNSGIKSIGKKIIVEICSTERLDSPIGKDGVIFCNNEYLELLVMISNNIIEKSTSKLYKLVVKLGKDLSTHKTNQL